MLPESKRSLIAALHEKVKGSGDANKDDEFRFFEEAAGDHSPRALINLTSNTAGTVFISQKRKPLQAKITIKSITVTQTWSGDTTLNGKKMKPVTDAAVLEKSLRTISLTITRMI